MDLLKTYAQGPPKGMIGGLCAIRGRHALYEGSEKSRYTCKFCGQSFTSLQIMTAMKCYRHPLGTYKGKHEPAL